MSSWLSALERRGDNCTYFLFVTQGDELQYRYVEYSDTEHSGVLLDVCMKRKKFDFKFFDIVLRLSEDTGVNTGDAIIQHVDMAVRHHAADVIMM